MTKLKPSCNKCGRTPRAAAGEYHGSRVLRWLRISPTSMYYGVARCMTCGWSVRVSAPTPEQVAAALLAPGLIRYRK